METLPLTDAPLAPKGSDKIWSMLSHLSALLGVGFVLPLVVYLAMRKESEYVATNAREALNFHISVLIYAVCCIPLVFILIGIPMLTAQVGLLTSLGWWLTETGAVLHRLRQILYRKTARQ